MNVDVAKTAIRGLASRALRLFGSLRAYLRLTPFDVSIAGGRERERTRRVVVSAAAAFLAKGAAILAILVSTPLAYGYLGAERFGLWIALSSVVAALSFADFGIGNGLLNLISEAHGREDTSLARRAVATTTLVLVVISAGLGASFAFLIYPQVDWGALLHINDPTLDREGRLSICIVVASVIVTVPLLTVQRVQAGFQDGLQVSMWQVLGSVFTIVGVVVATRTQASLPLLVGVTVGGPILSLALSWIREFGFARRWLFPNLRYMDIGLARRVLRLGALWTWFQLMAFVGASADNFIIAYFFGAAAVGGYAVMGKLLSGLLIAQMVSAPLWPAFAEALERNDHEWIEKTYHRALRLFSLLGVASAVVLGIGSYWIIPLWVSDELTPPILLAAGFALWGFVVNVFAAVSSFMANNRFIRRLTLLTTMAALSSLALKLGLAEKLGVTWAVWATAIGYGAACFLGLRHIRSVLQRAKRKLPHAL